MVGKLGPPLGTALVLRMDIAFADFCSYFVPASIKGKMMTSTDQDAPKMHYICQTYVAKNGGAKGASLEIGKQFQYTSASQAEERANRESRSEECIGADAYMVAEDLNTGEVGPPTFLARFGTVPEVEDF